MTTEDKIRNILTYAQATQDEKMKKIADLVDNAIKEAIDGTMYFVRTHKFAGSYPNIVVRNEIFKYLNEKES